MKKFLLISALAIGLGSPAISNAAVSAFGVNIPVAQNEVSDNIRGGYVAKDLGDTFQVQRLSSSSESLSGDNEDGNSYYVFGVRIGSDDLI